MAQSIKKDIRGDILSKLYLVHGEEEFLKDYYKDALIKKIVDKDFADFNYKKMDGVKLDTDEAEMFFASYPFMSEKKLLYIKNSGIFKKASEDTKKFWLKFLDELPDFAIVVFSEKEVDKRGALYKLAASKYAADEFPYQKRPELISWVVRYFNKFEKTISDTDADYLIECASENMYILKSEIEKLSLYRQNAKVITRDDIDIAVCRTPASRVFKMIDDILDGKIKEAGEKLGELKLLKEEPIALTAAVFSKYSMYRKEKLFSLSMSPREIAAKTGQKDFFVNLHLKQIKNISIEKLDKVLEACRELDYKIKAGLSDPWAEFEILFATMCK